MVSWKIPQVNGGMANVCDSHPTREGEAHLGGDLWGWFRTRDAYKTWAGQMFGQHGIGAIYARGCKFSLADPDACYVAIGVLKSGGGYFGTCKGIALSRHAGPAYGGNITSGSPAAVMPRPVGRLIDVTMAGGVEHIFTAAYNGLMASTDKGQTWKTQFSHQGNWKAVAAVSDGSYIACLYQSAGVTLVQSGTASHPTAPGILHDLTRIAGVVWACGPQGVYQWSGTAFLKHQAASAAVSGQTPVTIDGSSDGQTIVIGTAGPAFFVSHDGGKTWQNVGTAARAVMQTLDGRPYWLAGVNNGWGGSHFSASVASVDKVNPQKILVAGRAGGWGTLDGGQSFHPCAPQGSEVSHVKAGPGADEFAGDDTDWTGWHTTDAFGHSTAKQAQTGLHSGTQFSAGGHTYSVVPGDIKRDGVSIADDLFRGSCVDPTCGAVAPSGKILVGQYGGPMLLGTP